MGQLVTDSRLLTVSLYSSRVCLTSPEGSLPFFEEKPWTVRRQVLNMGQDTHGTHAPRCLPLAGLALTTPNSESALGQLSNPSAGQPLNP
jgi:hypothetical protein